jgi:hypothetical protein
MMRESTIHRPINDGNVFLCAQADDMREYNVKKENETRQAKICGLTHEKT